MGEDRGEVEFAIGKSAGAANTHHGFGWGAGGNGGALFDNSNVGMVGGVGQFQGGK